MSYEIAELIKEAYLAGHAAGHAKADELLSYLPKVPTQPYEKELAQQLAAERARSSRLVDVLSNVRSQMCWDRDRDQLSMGMRDVHSSVTETLAEYEGGK